jgi:DNA polymerase III epsilon subunit-like protein
MALVAFDLEFIGQDITRARLWEIGAVIMTGPRAGSQYSSVVECPLHVNGKAVKQYPGYQKVTPAFLKRESARPLEECLRGFFDFCGDGAVCMSHGCFRSDKIILERECRAIKLKPKVYFLDSLFILRDYYQGRDKYSLASFTGKTQHRALPDALALANLMSRITWEHRPVKIFELPLRSIRGVGRRTEQIYNSRSISSVEELCRAYR